LGCSDKFLYKFHNCSIYQCKKKINLQKKLKEKANEKEKAKIEKAKIEKAKEKESKNRERKRSFISIAT